MVRSMTGSSVAVAGGADLARCRPCGGRNVGESVEELVEGGLPSGAERETFEPRFSFHGSRFVRVTGHPGPLAPEGVVGVVDE